MDLPLLIIYNTIVKSEVNDEIFENGMYAMNLDTLNRGPYKNIYLDIFPGTLKYPTNDDVPYWGHFANEPSKTQEENVRLDQLQTQNRKQLSTRQQPYPGMEWLVAFKAIREIKPGEEITWCYGKHMTLCEIMKQVALTDPSIRNIGLLQKLKVDAFFSFKDTLCREILFMGICCKQT